MSISFKIGKKSLKNILNKIAPETHPRDFPKRMTIRFTDFQSFIPLGQLNIPYIYIFATS